MVNDIKLLGVKIDDKLQLCYQVKQVKVRTLQAFGLIKHAKKFLPVSDLQKMYRGIVEPHFSYCCSIWGCYGESELNSRQKIQHRAARMAANSPYGTPAAPVLQSLCWLSIKDVIRKGTAMLTYKYLNSFATLCLTELFTKCSEDIGIDLCSI